MILRASADSCWRCVADRAIHGSGSMPITADPAMVGNRHSS